MELNNGFRTAVYVGFFIVCSARTTGIYDGTMSDGTSIQLRRSGSFCGGYYSDDVWIELFDLWIEQL